MTRWLTAAPWPYGAAEAAAFVDSAGLDEYPVRLCDRLVGMVRAGQSFGIWIASGHQRQGIALRAAILALSRRFLAGAAAVDVTHLEENHRVAVLLERLGFRPTGAVTLWSHPRQKHLPGVSLRLSRQDTGSRWSRRGW
ncbi:GNAT family N-acetyltransferase [Paracoccus salsus]|uniref:GNAT family N-acetyltransferase n=1 Tax=Paracoccus salsus TaxID=2911061 RepID=UPI001F2B0DAA|nr:GNAT family N-acetyltransferase [Paracoccus salsus]